MRNIFVLLFLILTVASAQNLTGNYTMPSESLNLNLVQDAAGTLTGSLTDADVNATLQGQMAPNQAGAAFGLLSLDGEQIAFEIYSQDTSLYMYLFDTLPDGSLDVENALELAFVRNTQANPTVASSPSPHNSAASNPLTPQAPPTTVSETSDPFAGSFTGDGIELSLTGQNPYTGMLSFQGQQYPVQASSSGSLLQGRFDANGTTFSFEAKLQGINLSLVTGGVTYNLNKQASSNPASVPTLGAQAPATQSPATQAPATQAPATQAPTGQVAQSPNMPASQGQVIQIGQRYQAGVVLSPSTGLSITIPEGYSAEFDASSDAFILLANDQSHAIGIRAFIPANAEELGTYVVTELASDEVQLSNTIALQQSSNTISAGYRIMSEDGQLAMFVSAKDSQAGNAVVVAGFSGLKTEQELQTLIQPVIDGISLGNPSSAQLQQYTAALGGKTLERVGGYSDYDAGIAPDDYASSAGQTTQTYTFCSNGSYGYEYYSVFYFSTGAGSASSEESDQHQGNWRLGMNIVGSPAIVLNVSDGRFLAYPVAETNAGVAIGDSDYQLSVSDVCN